MLLPRSFYARPTLDVAADLLGKVLVHRGRAGTTAGIIVEAEAYIGEQDPACHAAAGPTRRNQPMYGEPGHAYVYLNYGVHFLFNIVTEPEGSPAAVLIRALQPVDGIGIMRRRRASRRGARSVQDHDLCRGPGNLTRAMGITIRDNHADLCGGRLFLEDRGVPAGEVLWGPRIGIAAGTDLLWRCCLAGSPTVSGRRPIRGHPRPQVTRC
ncbi:MAG: DNA-3-methyladenine glycosylase [Acidobacteria bacterium]|nr:DNA-3-methyladenine glycosylase [Acidobacteriota bacterium]